MQHVLTPYSHEIPPFVRWEDAFTEHELNLLQQRAKAAPNQATVGGESEYNDVVRRIRRSSVDWVKKEDETAWIFEKLGHVVASLNAQFYKFDITGFGERLQLTHYDHADQGAYGWHQDYGSIGAPSRKLSLTLQLTDPCEYEGGNLQIMTHGEPMNVTKRRGLITVFPSYAVHQVTPVTQGSRQSLVAWISGPEFK